jgi:hypothetical protein
MASKTKITPVIPPSPTQAQLDLKAAMDGADDGSDSEDEPSDNDEPTTNNSEPPKQHTSVSQNPHGADFPKSNPPASVPSTSGASSSILPQSILAGTPVNPTDYIKLEIQMQAILKKGEMSRVEHAALS